MSRNLEDREEGDWEDEGDANENDDNENIDDDDSLEMVDGIPYYFVGNESYHSRLMTENWNENQDEKQGQIMNEHIAQDITSTSWSPSRHANTPGALLRREINFNCPFSSQNKVGLFQKHLPCNGAMRFQYDHQVFCGQYSQDGSVFMSACQDRHIRLYETQTWRQTKDIEARDIGWSIIDTDYSPDQRWLIYSSWSDYVHLCNIYGDFEIHDALNFVPGSERFCLFSIKFSPDSNEILGGSSDRHIYIYDLDRKERTVRVEAHEEDINSVCYLDSTGQIIVTGSDDQMVKVWDRRMLGSSYNSGCVGVLPGHMRGITHVSPKGDGRYVISNGKDQCIKLWDIRSMTPPSSQTSGGRRRARWDYRSGPLGLGLDLGQTWRRHANDQSLMTYRGHKVMQTLIRAYFSPLYTTGNKYIYTGSYDGSVYIYDVLTGGLVSVLKGHRAIIRDLSWHPSDTTLVSTSWDGSVWEWAVEDDRSANPAASRRRRFMDHY